MENGLKHLAGRILPANALDAARRYRAERMNAKLKAMTDGERERALIKWFESTTGERFEKSRPETFNQKIQWLKLYDSTPIKGRLADKYLVREFVEDRIGEGYLVPLIAVYDDPMEISLEGLPQRFALKATHGSGWNVIVEDKAAIDWDEAMAKVRSWMKMDFAFTGGFELHYQYCEPRIVVEEYLDGFSDGSLIDYKVHVFNAGEPIILVCSDRSACGEPKKAYYDSDWNKLPLMEGGCETFDCSKPSRLNEMLSFSAQLAKDFAMVRVDWYEVSGRLYFGEMTFTPANGIKAFIPSEWNYEFGRRIDLSALHGRN